MDLFDLFDKFNNSTLTEKDILMFEYQGYLRDRVEETPEEEIKEEAPKKLNRKISRDHHKTVKQRAYR